MRPKEFYPFWFVCLFMLFSHQVSISDELETIIEGVKYNNSLILSGKGELIIERNYTSFGEQRIADQTGHRPQARKDRVLYAFKKSKIRCEQPNLIEVFDGEKYVVYREKGNGRPVGEIHGSNQMHVLYDPRYWGMRYGREPVGKFLERHAQKVIGQEKLGEDTCTIIEAEEPSHTEIRLRFWVNIQNGYRISKMWWEYPVNKSAVIYRFFYKEYQKGIWFPQSGWYEVLYTNETTGKLEVSSKFTMKIENSAINVDIQDTVFHIDFPEEIRILAYRTGTIRSPDELQ